MIFKRELAAKVMSGEKTVTRRRTNDNPRSPWFIDRCGYEVGRDYAVCPGRGVNSIGRIVIISTSQCRLGSLDWLEARREGFAHPDSFVRIWNELHGDYDPKEWVWRVEFRVIE